jgi:hypothetical protein
LIETINMIDQTMVDITPSALSRVGVTMPPSRPKTVCMA